MLRFCCATVIIFEAQHFFFRQVLWYSVSLSCTIESETSWKFSTSWKSWKLCGIVPLLRHCDWMISSKVTLKGEPFFNLQWLKKNTDHSALTVKCPLSTSLCYMCSKNVALPLSTENKHSWKNYLGDLQPKSCFFLQLYTLQSAT